MSSTARHGAGSTRMQASAHGAQDWWRGARRICGFVGAALALWCTGGCLTGRAPARWLVAPAATGDAPAFAMAQQTVREAFPPVYRAAQRAIISVHGRQFVCDGVLTASPVEGWHLAVISTLGLVTDLRVKADGSTEVLKVTPLFRENWAREYVARELRWLFAPPPALVPVGRLTDGRLVLEAASPADQLKARYACSADGRRWEALEVLSGEQALFHATMVRYGPFPGWPRAVPAEIEVDSGTHQLHLRTVGAGGAAASPGEGAR